MVTTETSLEREIRASRTALVKRTATATPAAAATETEVPSPTETEETVVLAETTSAIFERVARLWLHSKLPPLLRDQRPEVPSPTATDEVVVTTETSQREIRASPHGSRSAQSTATPSTVRKLCLSTETCHAIFERDGSGQAHSDRNAYRFANHQRSSIVHRD